MIGKDGWSIQMYQIGVDIGGTFTDCSLIGTDGRGTGAYASAKALSTRDHPVDGVMAGLEKAGRQRRPFGGAAADVGVRARHDDRHQHGAGALGGPGRARDHGRPR